MLRRRMMMQSEKSRKILTYFIGGQVSANRSSTFGRLLTYNADSRIDYAIICLNLGDRCAHTLYVDCNPTWNGWNGTKQTAAIFGEHYVNTEGGIWGAKKDVYKTNFIPSPNMSHPILLFQFPITNGIVTGTITDKTTNEIIWKNNEILVNDIIKEHFYLEYLGNDAYDIVPDN